jgi:hypothetical protein
MRRCSWAFWEESQVGLRVSFKSSNPSTNLIQSLRPWFVNPGKSIQISTRSRFKSFSLLTLDDWLVSDRLWNISRSERQKLGVIVQWLYISEVIMVNLTVSLDATLCPFPIETDKRPIQNE